ncbi:MAG: GTPase HflX [Comamonadaceae bacterium]|nr:GTPase HflX [Comamonadaceae bacterium]
MNNLSNAVSTPVLLVGVDFHTDGFDANLEELGLLVQSAGMRPVGKIACKRQAPDPALFVGKGKAEEIKALATQLGALEVVFDQSLSPAQQRNLERHWDMPVNDRTLLILEIFAQRARSHEGKLQVELARLQYLSTRLVRRWSHLERQRGGIGNRGGPGETQIELDRRMLGEGIKRTRERLEKVMRQRQTQRKQRMRKDAFRMSLVGYTNAGKSTLFNALVKAKSYAADQLFATLDTTTRQIYLGQTDGLANTASLSDTVGFIRDLPHGLVKAFAATLQEAAEADLLLHVVDANHPEWAAQIQQVQNVLHEIGAEKIPQLMVFNKVDALPDFRKPVQVRDFYELDGDLVDRFFISAQSGLGLSELRTELARRVSRLQGEPVAESL